MKSQDWIRFFIPLLIAVIVVYFFPMSAMSGSKINARPPAFVFAIVWTILYFLISISWSSISADSSIIDSAFLGLNILLALWVISYQKAGAKTALYVLLIALLAAGTLTWYLTVKNEIFSAGLIIPLCGWSLFALMLNFTEVNMMK